MNKYRAIKTIIDGVTFDSKAEAKRWHELRMLERAGHIERLERQVKFPLVVDGVHIATYRADFVYWSTAPVCRVVEDVKSEPTAKKRDFVIIRKLMRAIHKTDIQVIM